MSLLVQGHLHLDIFPVMFCLLDIYPPNGPGRILQCYRYSDNIHVLILGLAEPRYALPLQTV